MRRGISIDDVGLTAHGDVAGGALVLHGEHLDLHRPVCERLEGERSHGLGRAFGHHDLDRRARLHQAARELDHLVHGDQMFPTACCSLFCPAPLNSHVTNYPDVFLDGLGFRVKLREEMVNLYE